MKFKLFETDNVKIKSNGLIGTLVDGIYNETFEKYIYVLETQKLDDEGHPFWIDVWEDELEYV